MKKKKKTEETTKQIKSYGKYSILYLDGMRRYWERQDVKP